MGNTSWTCSRKLDERKKACLAKKKFFLPLTRGETFEIEPFNDCISFQQQRWKKRLQKYIALVIARLAEVIFYNYNLMFG